MEDPKGADRQMQQCRRTWAPRGRPPTLTHPFNWKKASMAAAQCYGVRGDRGIKRVRRTPYLAYSFLRHTGLSVS